MAALKDLSGALDEIVELTKDLRAATQETDLGDAAIVAERIATRAETLAGLYRQLSDAVDSATGRKREQRKDEPKKS